MKKIICVVLTVALILVFGAFAMGSTSSDDTSKDQGNGTVDATQNNSSNLGDYNVEIKSCRLAKDYEGKDIVIVNFSFTNNADEAVAFYIALENAAFQDGVGLNRSYIAQDSANYSEDNQTKKLQKGATLDVEVAYELNNTTSDVVVEVSELISFNDAKITKTFKITE